MDQRVSIPGRIQQNEWVTNPSRNDGWRKKGEKKENGLLEIQETVERQTTTGWIRRESTTRLQEGENRTGRLNDYRLIDGCKKEKRCAGETDWLRTDGLAGNVRYGSGGKIFQPGGMYCWFGIVITVWDSHPNPIYDHEWGSSSTATLKEHLDE